MIWLTLISLLLVVVMTYFNWSSNRNSAFLGIYLGLLSLYALTHYLMVIDFQPSLAAVLFNHLTPFYLLFGPALFWYTRGVIADDFVFKRSDLLHLLPALIQFVAIFEYSFFTPFADKVALIEQIKQQPETVLTIQLNSFFSTSFNVVVRLISLVSYGAFSFFFLIRYMTQNVSSARAQLRENLVLRWVIYLHLSSGVLVGLYFTFLNRFASDDGFLESNAAGSIQTAIGIITSLNNLSLVLFPELLYGIPKRRSLGSRNSDNESNMPIGTKDELQSLPYKDSVYFATLAQEIEQYMWDQKPYLNPEFNLQTAAQDLAVPQHHITLCIRAHFNLNFSSLRNRYRIEYAKELLAHQSDTNVTIEAIAQDCGFKSRTAFYNAFSRLEGSTPTNFNS